MPYKAYQLMSQRVLHMRRSKGGERTGARARHDGGFATHIEGDRLGSTRGGGGRHGVANL